MNPSNLILVLFALLPPAALAASVAVVRRHRRGGGVGWLVLGNVLVFGFLLSLVLLGGEVWFRFLYDATDGYDLGLVSERWIARHYTRNDFGMRDDVEYTVTPPAGTTRVAFLGDSYTNGHGIVDVERRFVNRVRADRPAWDVQMIADDGLDTGALIERLERLYEAGWHTDVLVYVYCLNDISDLVPEWRRAAERIYGERPGFWIGHSYLLNTVYWRSRVFFDPGLADYFDVIARAYEGAPWREQQARLERLLALARDHGATPAVVTFPFLETMSREDYRAIHRRLDEFWAAHDVARVDLLDVFAGHEPSELTVNRFDTHANAEAHALATSAIERLLDRVIGG